jgi:hypothetical protein
VRVDLFAVDDQSSRVAAAHRNLEALLKEEGGVAIGGVGVDQGLGAMERPVVGLLFWVRADDVGGAAMTAVDTAIRAGLPAGVGPDLYDVTVVPLDAVSLPDDPLYPAPPD